MPSKKVLIQEKNKKKANAMIIAYIAQVSEFVNTSDTFIAANITGKKYLDDEHAETIKININKMHEDGNRLLDQFAQLENDSLDDLIYSLLHPSKELLLTLYKNTTLLLIASTQFFIKKLNQVTNEKNEISVIGKYFNFIKSRSTNPTRSSKFLTLKKLPDNFNYYQTKAKILLENNALNLLDDTQMISQLFEAIKLIFLAMPAMLSNIESKAVVTQIKNNVLTEALGHTALEAAKIFKTVALREKEGQMKDCNNYIENLRKSKAAKYSTNNLKDINIEQLLSAEEQALKESDQKLNDIYLKKTMKLKLKISSRALKANDQAQPTNDENVKNIDLVQKAIDDYKKTINEIYSIKDLKKCVEKIDNIERFAKQQELPLNIAQQLELATCLVWSVSFAWKITIKTN